jgi:hypothetical protein
VEYDDERVLTDYVWNNYTHLMTDFERLVGLAIVGRAKVAAIPHPDAARVLGARWGRVGTPEVDAALAEGPESYRRQVCRRLLAEAGDRVFVNRCPACRRVVRTPTAKQCFWCGHDWHDQGKPEEPD